MNYTKGQWKTRMRADGSRIIYSELETGDEIICSDVRHFNMDLICSAPELYEALNEIISRSIYLPQTRSNLILIQKAKEAIRKAEGK